MGGRISLTFSPDYMVILLTLADCAGYSINSYKTMDILTLKMSLTSPLCRVSFHALPAHFGRSISASSFWLKQYLSLYS